MSHTVHPYSHRLGIIRDWKSRWFSSDKAYRTALKGDLLIREFLKDELRANYVGGLDIERNQKTLRIIVKTSRPGLLIGKAGDGITKLRAKVLRLLHDNKLNLGSQELKIDVEEIRNPESNAAIAAMMVAESLEKRLPFRRVMKQTIEKVMANKDVKGIRIRLGGRLGGAEIARSEELKKGQIPLQTLRADIDFAREEARMTYGNIGIKVWIYKGEIFKKDQ
ncbi:MAG: 30S ribosomal protein S3 [Patescibacteria group bacterium]|nr:30S ribosomal protein S3 [Patescibacteria group bacterium]